MAPASMIGLLVDPNSAFPGVSNTHPLCIFTLCLQFLSYDDLGEVVADLGFDGVELVVAKGRHVLPENVKIDLPKAVNAMRKAGIDVPMIVTEINDADHHLTEDILGTAADLGVKYYRMGKYYYNNKLSVFENLNHYKQKLKKLEILNRKYNLQGGYQNHSGPWGMVGGAEMGNANPSMPPRKIYKHLVRDLHFFRHEFYGN
jgi:sugar phosphate isomerase/epimerase